MGQNVTTLLLAALALLLVWAGIEDARKREIANWKNIAIAVMAPLWWWANGLPVWPDMALQLGIGLLVFALFAGAFAIGQMGGGDVKLIGALALWLPVQPLVSTVVMMTVLGGGLTLLMIADQWVRSRQGVPRLSRPALAVLLALVAGAFLLSRPSTLAALLAEPVLLLGAMFGALCLVALLLLTVIRAARKRGILPETPYGVAIAIAGLLTIREPIFNHFG